MARKRKVSEIEDSEISCYYCNKPIPDNSMKCPHCGKVFSVAKKILAVSIILIMVIASLGYVAYDNYLNTGQEGYEGDEGFDGDDIINPDGSTSTDTKTIKIELYTDKAPITTKNFIDLANTGKYNNVPFHRIIADFMIQGGDFTNQDGTGGHAAEYHNGLGNPSVEDTWAIPDEFHPDLKNIQYALSMANSGPDTGGSQFFIVTKVGGTDWLDNKHAVFGIVVEGQSIVDALGVVPTDPGDGPVDPAYIQTVTISQIGAKTYATMTVVF